MTKRGMRREVHLSEQVSEMLDDIVDNVSKYGPQKDVSVSEVFQGLVYALHRSIDDVKLKDVPPRGQWGTATEKSFVYELGLCFEEAISRGCRKSAIQSVVEDRFHMNGDSV